MVYRHALIPERMEMNEDRFRNWKNSFPRRRNLCKREQKRRHGNSKGYNGRRVSIPLYFLKAHPRN